VANQNLNKARQQKKTSIISREKVVRKWDAYQGKTGDSAPSNAVPTAFGPTGASGKFLRGKKTLSKTKNFQKKAKKTAAEGGDPRGNFSAILKRVSKVCGEWGPGNTGKEGGKETKPQNGNKLRTKGGAGKRVHSGTKAFGVLKNISCTTATIGSRGPVKNSHIKPRREHPNDQTTSTTRPEGDEKTPSSKSRRTVGKVCVRQWQNY